jgi:hypothetical protein
MDVVTRLKALVESSSPMGCGAAGLRGCVAVWLCGCARLCSAVSTQEGAPEAVIVDSSRHRVTTITNNPLRIDAIIQRLISRGFVPALTVPPQLTSLVVV